MSSASEKTTAALVATPWTAAAPALQAAVAIGKPGTPWGKALAAKRRIPTDSGSEEAGDPPIRWADPLPPLAADGAPAAAEALAVAAEPEALVVLAQLDPAASTQPGSSTASNAAPLKLSPSMATSEIGLMTRASSVLPVMPGSDYLSNWLGPAPLGAVAGGAVLVGLAAIGGGGKGSSAAAADTSAPVLLGVANSADGSKLILTYSEALSPTAPDRSAFAVTADGVAVAVSGAARGSSNTSTLELTLATPITSIKAVKLSYTAPALIGGIELTTPVKDVANNRAANITAKDVTIADAVAPVLTSATAYTATDSSTVVLTYSEPLLASAKPVPGAYAVQVNNVAQAVSAVDIVGNQVFLTLQNKIASGTGLANTIQVVYTAPSSDASPANAAVQDITGNDAASISTPRVITNPSFDTAAPTLKSAAINAAGKSITLVMTEALDASRIAPASAYFVQITEGAVTRSVAVESTSVAGDLVTLVLAERLTNPAAGLQVSYSDPSAGGSGPALQDLAGNNAANLIGATVVNNIDTAAPSLALASFKDSKTLVLTFSETLAAATAGASAFSVTTAGAVNAVTAVKVVGSALELSLTTAVLSGQATQLSYTAPASDGATATNAALQDATGNDAAAITAFSVDTTAPTLVGQVTGALGNQIVLAFDSPLLAGSTPAGGAFTVLGSKSGPIVVSSVAVSGTQATLTLASSLQPTETVSLSYSAPSPDIATTNLALQDLAGNDLASQVSLVVPNKIAPVLLKNTLVYDPATGFKQVVLEFNDTLVGTPPDASAFTVLAGGTAQAISSLSVNGGTVTLTLAAPLTGSGAVTVLYAKPGTNPLADSDGNAVASTTPISLGALFAGTPGADTLVGGVGLDYFMASLGNDTLTGAGGADLFVWPALANPAGLSQTITDFGFKGASGSLQGALEADTLDLRAFLVGYTAETQGKYLSVAKNTDGKLVLSIDRDGGSSFEPQASVVLSNISVNSSDQLTYGAGASLIAATAGGLSGVLTLANVLAQLESDSQLRVL